MLPVLLPLVVEGLIDVELLVDEDVLSLEEMVLSVVPVNCFVEKGVLVSYLDVNTVELLVELVGVVVLKNDIVVGAKNDEIKLVSNYRICQLVF
ncbi:hypothetical protein ACJMK2_022074, partial [Sinanodonta woodiana]